MRESDLPAFVQLLADVRELLSPRSPPLSEGATALAVEALVGFDLQAIRRAMQAHLRGPRGAFVPSPGELVALIGAEHHDGRLGAEEAWAGALAARDEDETVVWTEEAAQAFATCRPVLLAGDEVGARMAFREAYNRLVQHARTNGMPCTWIVTQGRDPERRRVAISAAVESGILPKTELLSLPPPPRSAAALMAAPDHGHQALLSHDTEPIVGPKEREARAKLASWAEELRDAGAKPIDTSERDELTLEQRQARAELAERARQWRREHRNDDPPPLPMPTMRDGSAADPAAFGVAVIDSAIDPEFGPMS